MPLISVFRRQRLMDPSEIEAKMVYIVSSRKARAT